LFLAANAMSWLIDPSLPLLLRREVYALAHEAGNWREAEAKSRLNGIFSRTHAAARGETVEWKNKKVDARYRFRDETIIEWLDITEEEMKFLGFRHLATKDMKRERNTKKKRDSRHKAGKNKLTKDEYQQHSQIKKVKAMELRNQGISFREIANELNVSLGAVQYYLK
jgi:hypothetical protein